MRAPEIVLDRIHKRFGAVVANESVSLTLAPGEVHAVIGENGAGKSTLMNVLYGMTTPDGGTLSIDGRVVRLASPQDAMRHGLGMVHQHFLLVETLTVAENIVLGREPRTRLGTFDRAAAESQVAALADRVGLPVDPRARVGSLGVGQQQRVEILKALHRGARVLILDEPTAVLTPQEVDELFALLRTLRAGGTTLVLITHKLGEVMALADRVTVLRRGRDVGSGRVADLDAAQLAEWMMGRVLAPLQARSPRAPGGAVLAAEALEVHDARGLPAVRGLDLEVRAGEIVGIAGVEGNGQHELLEAIAGLRAPRSGRLRIAGHDVTGRGVAATRSAGLAHIPADRLARGLVPTLSLAENLVLGRHDDPRVGHGPWLGGPAWDATARSLLTAYDVRPPDPGARAAQLSGGNQQKLIAARELGLPAGGAERTLALLAAHPTRGVDLGAIDAIHRRLLAARDEGLGVLLVSSELSELMALADRILVLHAGRIVHATTPAATDERTLGLHMTGRANLIDTPLPSAHHEAPRA